MALVVTLLVFVTVAAYAPAWPLYKRASLVDVSSLLNYRLGQVALPPTNCRLFVVGMYAIITAALAAVWWLVITNASEF